MRSSDCGIIRAIRAQPHPNHPGDHGHREVTPEDGQIQLGRQLIKMEQPLDEEGEEAGEQPQRSDPQSLSQQIVGFATQLRRATLDDRHGMAVRGYVCGINWRNVQRLVNSTSLSGALHF